MPRNSLRIIGKIAANNRTAILEAATDLFLELGYDRTSLARVADRADVSKATLFKQFPTKAELFEATVLAAGDTSDSEPLEPPSGDFLAGLVSLGVAYAELLSRPRTADLIRAVIAESARFPELRQRTFDFGTLPVLRALRRYFQTANAQGIANVNDSDVATAQFLGMIATVGILAPPRSRQLVAHRRKDLHTVDEAARTIVARYATTQSAQTCAR